MVDLFRSRVKRITAQGEPFCEDPPVNEYDSLTEFLFQMYNCPRFHCIANFLFKTETLKTNGSFMDLPVAWFSDDATTMICAENGVCNTADILFSFRESGINISNVSLSKEKNALKKIDATMQFYDWFTHYYERHYNAFSSVNQVKWQQIKSGVRDRVFGLLIPYSKRLGFIKFKSLYHWLDRYDFFSEKRKLFVFIGVRLTALFTRLAL